MIDNRIKLAEKILDESNVDEYERALSICSEVLHDSTDKIECYLAHELRCTIYSLMDNVEYAINEASAMIDIEHSQPHPLFKRARLFLRLGRNAEAIDDLSKVIEFDEHYFRETALLMRSFANLEINKKCSISDAMLLEDGFSFFIRTEKFGYKEFSKEELLRMASDSH